MKKKKIYKTLNYEINLDLYILLQILCWFDDEFTFSNDIKEKLHDFRLYIDDLVYNDSVFDNYDVYKEKCFLKYYLCKKITSK